MWGTLGIDILRRMGGCVIVERIPTPCLIYIRRGFVDFSYSGGVCQNERYPLKINLSVESFSLFSEDSLPFANCHRPLSTIVTILKEMDSI